MARAKSDDKRSAILAAAVQLIAERGLDAVPTAAISKAAGVAEGTLFTYFKTKDDLVNELYRQVKVELADVMMCGFPRENNDIRVKLQHIWNAYVTWGVANPNQRKVLNQLRLCDRITEESKAAGYAPFAEVQSMTMQAVAEKRLRDYPHEFVAAAMGALAETSMDFMTAFGGDDAAGYRNIGFEMFWKSISESDQET